MNDPKKHTVKCFFSPESSNTHVSNSSHSSLIFAPLGNKENNPVLDISQKIWESFTCLDVEARLFIGTAFHFD